MKSILVAVLMLAAGATSLAAPKPAKNSALTEFGEAIAHAINERDPQAMHARIDGNALGLRISGLLEFSPASEKAFLESFLDKGLPGAIDSLMKMIGQTEGTARFMHATNAKPSLVLVRIDMGDSGFEYLEFQVETAGGKTRAVDWFRLSSGELISQTIASTAQLFVTHNRDVVGRLLGVTQIDDSAMNILRQYGELQRKGDYGAALDRLNDLPDSIGDTRVMLTLRANIASLAERDADYGRFLAKLAEKHGNDPSTAFLLIDHYVNTNDIPRMLEAIGVMEKRVGKDGVTEQLRATAYFLQEDYTSALRHMDESVRLEPARVDGLDVRATMLVRLGRYADAVAQYREIEERFGLRFSREIFAEDPGYADFVASPAFAEWLPAE